MFIVILQCVDYLNCLSKLRLNYLNIDKLQYSRQKCVKMYIINKKKMYMFTLSTMLFFSVTYIDKKTARKHLHFFLKLFQKLINNYTLYKIY